MSATVLKVVIISKPDPTIWSDSLEITDIFGGMDNGKITLSNNTTGEKYTLLCSFSERQKEMLKCGGLLGYTKAKNS